MLFKSLVPMTVYRGQKTCPTPKGEPIGKGEAIYLLAPNQKATVELLQNKFFDFTDGVFKKLYCDFIYNDKIGNSTVREKVGAVDIKALSETKFAYELSLIPKGGVNSVSKAKRNVIIDLGKWNELYFTHRKKVSPIKMCENYLSFIRGKIAKPEWDSYNKTIYIDAASWKNQLGGKLTFSASNVNNPITMILFLLYKNEDALSNYKSYDFVIMNSVSGSFIYFKGSDLNSDNYGKLKSRISDVCEIDLEIEKLEDLSIEEERAAIKMGMKDTTDDNKREAVVRKAFRERISRNFEDFRPELDKSVVTSEEDDDDYSEYLNSGSFDDDEGEDESKKSIDEQIEDEIDKYIEEYGLDDAEELINNNDEATFRKLASNASQAVYKNGFMPTYSKVEINRINRLTDKQNEVFKPLQSKEKMESKIIEETSLEGAINIPNEEILHPKFVNFDKSYNKKKMDRDIDNAVVALSSAKRKVFVTDKKVEDTSDQLTLKETRTYTLEDESGKKMTLKFDVPKIIDDNYVYINGNKKIIDHQFVAKPIIKNKPDEVKITTHYNKLIFGRSGLEDSSASPLLKYLIKHQKQMEVKLGNGFRPNAEYNIPLDFSIISKRIFQFKSGDWVIITSIPKLCEILSQKGIKYTKPSEDKYPIAYNSSTKEVMYLDTKKDNYIEKLNEILSPECKKAVRSINISKRQFFATCEIMNKKVPLALILLHTIGLTETLKRAGVKYTWIPNSEESKKQLREYHNHDYGRSEFADGTLVWERQPAECSFLMTGINNIDFSGFNKDELDDKDTIIYMLNKYYAHSNMSYNLDQYEDFMIDPVTKEVLEDFNLPTDYVGLLLLANKMLITTDFIPQTDIRNMRIRSNEIITQHTFKVIAEAYNEYRKSLNRVRITPISFKQDAIISKLMKDASTEEASIINPFFEVDRKYGITFKGPSGINDSRAFPIGKRAYTEEMLGVIAMVTDNAGNVGINRYLTTEANITSTRGYIDIKGREGLDDLSAPNLLTPSEMLMVMGVEHDDPARMAMAVKQSRVMIPVQKSEPGMITNGMDKALPYHLGKEFCIVAEEDGEIVDIKNDLVAIRYNSGRYQTIDVAPKVKKNSDSGFWIETQIVCDKKKGDKVKKNEVVGYDRTAFRKNTDDLSATMTRGPITKIAILPRWDCYEDSTPMTEKLSEDMASIMIMEETAMIKPNMPIHQIVKVGDQVKSGDPLITFDQYSQDDEVQAFMNIMRAKLREEGESFIESAASSVKAHYTGEIADIKIFSAAPLEDMCPETRKVVEEYYEEINKKIRFLKKYKNEGESDYYMSGQRVSEFPEPVKVKEGAFVKGERIGDDGIVFCFYIKFKDYIKKGDKITAEFALKGINSQVIAEGLEPYSEYRPDEEIGLIIAPHSPMARKTTGIFKTMFINKLLIEKKRQLTEYWDSVKKDLT